MQLFPTAVHEDWEGSDAPAATKAAIRAGAGMALAGLSGKVARVEAVGFAAADGRLLVRARLYMADIPGPTVWEQTVDPSALESAGVDFGSASATSDVAVALSAALADFLSDLRDSAEKRHL